MESCWRGSLGASKGHLQKLTVRAKTPVLSPSEVHLLCSGQLLSTYRSIGGTSSAVLGEHMMVFHMAMAALRVRALSQGGLRHSTGGPALAAISASAHCPSPAAPRQPSPVGTDP